MKKDIFSAIARFGEEMTVFSQQCTAGRSARGFIQAIEPKNTEKPRTRTAAGVADRATMLLMVGKEAILPEETGVTVAFGEKRYELLRRETVGCGNMKHWECVVRELRGGEYA